MILTPKKHDLIEKVILLLEAPILAHSSLHHQIIKSHSNADTAESLFKEWKMRYEIRSLSHGKKNKSAKSFNLNLKWKKRPPEAMKYRTHYSEITSTETEHKSLMFSFFLLRPAVPLICNSKKISMWSKKDEGQKPGRAWWIYSGAFNSQTQHLPFFSE